VTPSDVQEFCADLAAFCRERGVQIRGAGPWLALFGRDGELLATEAHMRPSDTDPWVIRYRLGHGVKHG